MKAMSMMNYEQFQNEGFLNKIKDIFKEKPKEDDYLAIKFLKYIEANKIVIRYSLEEYKELYQFIINKDTVNYPLTEEDYVDDINITIIHQLNSDKIEQVKLNDEVLNIRNELKVQLLNAVKCKMK